MSIEDLIQQRDAARSQRNYALADELRDKALAMGFRLVDSASGTQAIAITQDWQSDRFNLLTSRMWLKYFDEQGRSWGVCLIPALQPPDQSARWLASITRAIALLPEEEQPVLMGYVQQRKDVRAIA